VLLQVDVFSFGVVLWEVWTLGEQPYPNLSLQEIFAGVMTGTLRPSPPPDCDPDWMALMQVRVPPGPARPWSAAPWTAHHHMFDRMNLQLNMFEVELIELSKAVCCDCTRELTMCQCDWHANPIIVRCGTSDANMPGNNEQCATADC
jgi:hypothetical protein